MAVVWFLSLGYQTLEPFNANVMHGANREEQVRRSGEGFTGRPSLPQQARARCKRKGGGRVHLTVHLSVK